MVRNIFLTVVCVSSIQSYCQTDCYSLSGTGVDSVAAQNGINIVYDTSGVDSNIVNFAMGQWNDCSGNVPQFTSNSTSSTGPAVRVSIEQSNAPMNKLALYDITDKSITLYTKTYGGDNIDPNLFPKILMHELGHALGLADVSGSANSGCLMGQGVPTNNVVQADCYVIVDIWRSAFNN